MKFSDASEIVISTFAHNKMRTLLTVFAISIGIGAITLLVSLGFGLQRLTIEKISSSEAFSTLSLSAGNANLDSKTIDQIKALPSISYVGLNYAFSGRAIIGNSQTDSTVNLVDTNLLRLQALSYSAGGAYTDENADNALIISSQQSKALGFKSDAEAVGQTIHLTVYYNSEDVTQNQEIDLKINGVTKETTSNISYVPISRFKVPQTVAYSLVMAKLANSKDAAATQAQIEKMGISVYSVAQTIDQMNNIFKIVQYIFAAFGLIALFVAGIGMFNTLTISLLERTREIGIMRVLGATAEDVRKIFLIEAILMGFLGGLAGLAGSLIISTLGNVIVSGLAVKLGGEATNPFYTPWYFIGLVIGVSFIIGLVTGFYPARRAGKLNPLDALRYE